MKRREFVKNTGFLTAASLIPFSDALSHNGYKLNSTALNDLGIQLFSVPRLMEEDLVGGVGLLAQMGFKKLELYGPYPFSAASAKERWNSLIPRLGFSGSGFYGKTALEFSSIIRDHDIKIPSMHTDLDTLENHLDSLAKGSETLGFEYIVLPALPQEYRKNLEDYKKTAELFNSIGKKARQYGLKLTYHNHGYGLGTTDGITPMRYLIEHTDPEWVFLEMDLFWTSAGGADPVEYLKDYPGRYHLMHVKDMKEKRRFSGDGGDPGQWMELFPMMCSAGDGVLPLQKIIPAALKSGVKHFIVEQDMVAQPEIALQKSMDYLTGI
ncbi:MAG: TIM barrel protein [Flavobacteriaceae bacterium]